MNSPLITGRTKFQAQTQVALPKHQTNFTKVDQFASLIFLSKSTLPIKKLILTKVFNNFFLYFIDANYTINMHLIKLVLSNISQEDQ